MKKLFKDIKKGDRIRQPVDWDLFGNTIYQEAVALTDAISLENKFVKSGYGFQVGDGLWVIDGPGTIVEILEDSE